MVTVVPTLGVNRSTSAVDLRQAIRPRKTESASPTRRSVQIKRVEACSSTSGDMRMLSHHDPHRFIGSRDGELTCTQPVCGSRPIALASRRRKSRGCAHR